MNPAAPVTSNRMRLSLRSSAAPSPREDGPGLGAVRLELLCALEGRNGFPAAAHLVERVAEVVVRVALVRVGGPRSAQCLDCLLQERERTGVAPLLHQ